MAVAMRGEPADEVILHAERGCQCISARLARFAADHNRQKPRPGVRQP
jgi:putative transposase